MSQSPDLASRGWNDTRDSELRTHDGCIAGRVAVEHRGAYVVYTHRGDLWAEPAGRLRYDAEAGGAMPAVGDWVALRPLPGEDRAVVVAVLPRASAFSRKEAGLRTREQVLAANFDAVFIVTALDADVSARRVERYLTMGWESGAQPVVVGTKADVAEDPAAAVAEIEAVAIGAPVLCTSASTGEGLDAIEGYVGPGRTAVLLGMSGVGKSTLVNALAGTDVQATNEVRSADGRGRHTTTRRELLAVPSGGFVIDTPGMRELALWSADDGLDAAFEDIDALAISCRFRDCAHRGEPGCAVKAAIVSGQLDGERLRSYRKLERELAFLERRQDQAADLAEKRRRKAFSKSVRGKDR